MVGLAPHEAHIWLAVPDKHSDPALLASYRELLSDEEQAAFQRFRFLHHANLYLLSHALVRSTLSRYAPVLPEEWILKRAPHGRPEIAFPTVNPPLRFNLSRTTGLTACLVVLSIDAGVDVQDTAHLDDPMGLAEHYFSTPELKALRALSASAQRKRFFCYWALKEAYVKARGVGLGLPLDQSSFQIETGGRVEAAFAPELREDPMDWQFASYLPTSRHTLAVALYRKRAADMGISFWEMLPHGYRPLARGGEVIEW